MNDVCVKLLIFIFFKNNIILNLQNIDKNTYLCTQNITYHKIYKTVNYGISKYRLV